MDFSLCLVTDENISGNRSVIDIVKSAVEGGVTMVQLREKKLSTRKIIERAIELKNILNHFHIPLIINDRLDIALAVKADGIHIGQSDMPFEMARKLIPESMIIGLSIETIEQALEAENYKVNYLGVSPVFPTPTKGNFDEKPWGLDGLRNLRKLSKHKLIAIGGINKSNAADVIKAGADGLAVVSAICAAPDPKAATRELIDIIKTCRN